MRTTAIIFCLSVLFYSCADAPEEKAEAAEPTEVTAEENPTIEEKLASEDEPETVMDFTPEGYVLFKTFKGDLNKDEHEDMVAVFDAVDSNDEMLNRAVMLLAANADGKLTMAALNKDGAYCSECGGVMGDPFVEVVIKDGYFTIEHLGGSRHMWTDDPTFKYNAEKNAWFLHRHSKQVVDRMDPEGEESEQTMLTTKDFGEVNFEDFHY